MSDKKQKPKEIKKQLYTVTQYLSMKRTNPLHFTGKIAYAKQKSPKELMIAEDWDKFFKKY